MTPQPPIGALASAWHASIEAMGQASGVGIDLVEVEPLRQLLVAGGRSFVDSGLDGARAARHQQTTGGTRGKVGRQRGRHESTPTRDRRHGPP